MKVKLFCLLLFVSVLGLSCASTGLRDSNVTAVKKAKKKIVVQKEELIGNWKHISIAKTETIKGEPLKSDPIVWTLKEDGTGFYKKKDGKNKSSFKWELKNKNELILTPRGRGSSTTYTIVKKETSKMVWENNNLGDFYIVERQ